MRTHINIIDDGGNEDEDNDGELWKPQGLMVTDAKKDIPEEGVFQFRERLDVL